MKPFPDRGTVCVILSFILFVPWQTGFVPAHLPHTADGHADGSLDSDTEDVFHIFSSFWPLIYVKFYSTLPVPAVPDTLAWNSKESGSQNRRVLPLLKV